MNAYKLIQKLKEDKQKNAQGSPASSVAGGGLLAAKYRLGLLHPACSSASSVPPGVLNTSTSANSIVQVATSPNSIVQVATSKASGVSLAATSARLGAERIGIKLVGNAKQRQALRAWIWSVFRGEVKLGKEPLLHDMRIVHGPPGVGKTSAVVAYMKEAGFEVIRINASEVRTAGTLGRILKNSGSNSGLGRRPGLLLDEVDGLYNGTTTWQMFRDIRCTNPVISTCNQIPRELRGNGASIRFYEVFSSDLMTLIYYELERTGAFASREDVHRMAQLVGGDARQVPMVVKMRGAYGHKDDQGGAFRIVQHLLPGGRGGDAAIALTDIDGADDQIADILSANLPNVVGGVKAYSIVAADIANVDVFMNTLWVDGDRYISDMSTIMCRSAALQRPKGSMVSKRMPFAAPPTRAKRAREAMENGRSIRDVRMKYADCGGTWTSTRTLAIHGMCDMITERGFMRDLQ